MSDQFRITKCYIPVPEIVDTLGLIPTFLKLEDPRGAREQFAERYCSGWDPMPGFKELRNDTLAYPGDPLMHPLIEFCFRDERILIYEYSWVRVVQPDGSWEISRMD